MIDASVDLFFFHLFSFFFGAGALSDPSVISLDTIFPERRTLIFLSFGSIV
jgi:hypothetical protein